MSPKKEAIEDMASSLSSLLRGENNTHDDSMSHDGQRLCGSSPRPAEVPSIQEGSGGSNPPCRIRLRLCLDSHDFAAYRNIINTHHTYKRWTHVPGRKIAWLVEDTSG